MADETPLVDSVIAIIALEHDTLIATLVAQGVVSATIAEHDAAGVEVAALQGLRGPPGPQGEPGALPEGAYAELDLGGGVVVQVPLLPPLAVAQGATTPGLGAGVRALAWSSVLGAVVIWTGAAWEQALGGGPPVDPLALVNDAGEVLVNAQGEVIRAG